MPDFACGIKTVSVAALWRHETVGGHQDRTVKPFEFLFLFPPCIAVIADEIGVFFESRIGIGRQHFGMGVNIYACALGLLQQHLQIPQVMTGNQNAGAGVHTDIDFCHFRIAIGSGVGLVQQCHAFQTVFPGFQCQGDQVVCVPGIVQCRSQCALKEGIHFFVILQQNICMARIGGKALQAIYDQFPQAADVFVFGGEHTNFNRFHLKLCRIIG